LKEKLMKKPACEVADEILEDVRILQKVLKLYLILIN